MVAVEAPWSAVTTQASIVLVAFGFVFTKNVAHLGAGYASMYVSQLRAHFC
jgi:hypothetical protein